MKKKIENNNPDICVGVITSVNGVKGYVKIRSFTQSPKDIANFKQVYDHNGDVVNKISIVMEKKDYIIAEVAGIKNRNEAEILRNTKLYIKRSELPIAANEEYYHADLLGLDAKFEDGTSAGKVKNIENFGASDILEIYDSLSEKTLYYPFNRQFVPNVDLNSKTIILSKIEEAVTNEE